MKQRDFISLVHKFLEYGMPAGMIVQTLVKDKNTRKLGLYLQKKIDETGDFSESLLKTAEQCSGKIELMKRYGPLLKASEETGNLGGALACILRYLDQRDEAEKSLLCSLVYPIFMITLVMILSSFLCFGCGNFLKNTNVDIKKIQDGVLISSAAVMISLLVFMLAGFWTWKKDRFQADFFALLKNFSEGKIPLEKSLLLIAGILKNGRLRTLEILDGIKEGIPFSKSCTKTGIFDTFCDYWLLYGEETGMCEEAFGVLSIHFEKRRMERRRNYLRLAEPCANGITGVYIFMLMIKVALPVLTGLMPKI